MFTKRITACLKVLFAPSKRGRVAIRIAFAMMVKVRFFAGRPLKQAPSTTYTRWEPNKRPCASVSYGAACERIDTANLAHKWYHEHHVLGEPEPILSARLVLARATQIVIRNGLAILGITAPERM